ncbi:MAG TPA: thymidine phosphorylase family protein [Sphingomonadales bacterium]|nr:thymidine phosphorylase family protein [Sphingomonadales bacterium]
MALKLASFPVDTHGENVAYLSRCCAEYKPEEFVGLNKIEIEGAGGKRLLARLDIVEDPKILDGCHLGLSVPAFRRLGLPEGADVKIRAAAPPESLEFVRAKIRGATLSRAAIRSVVADVAGYRYSRMEIAAFLVACASFMTLGEILHLTRAMADAGSKLSWRNRMIVDKHCIGGVPGNRTSMLVVPIVAAHGLTIPKTSSRAITSPSGTADTMEVLAEVNLELSRMKRVVGKTNGCLAWGGKVNLSPADDIMISVERPLGIDTPEQMVASILSKKLAAGSTHLVIDIPIGPAVKARTAAEARRLVKVFRAIAKKVGIRLAIETTDGREPVGFGIGPVLEARDVMAVLERKSGAPEDLRERALLLAGRVLEFDRGVKRGCGYTAARGILDSGHALETMRAIIAAQGPPPARVSPGKRVHEVKAAADGVVRALDCWRLARIARTAGAPLYKGAGVDLLKKRGARVKQGEPLYRIHAELTSDFEFAKELAAENSGFVIGSSA